jgi:hypothetical protein
MQWSWLPNCGYLGPVIVAIVSITPGISAAPRKVVPTRVHGHGRSTELAACRGECGRRITKFRKYVKVEPGLNGGSQQDGDRGELKGSVGRDWDIVFRVVDAT